MFRRHIPFLALLILSGYSSEAQTTWRRTYGGLGSDEGNSVQQTSDGNFIVCGSTGSFGAGGGDIYLILLDPFGNLIWSQTYGGPGVEQGRCVRQTNDGGFIIAGFTNSFGAGGYDGYVVRTDPAGVMLWDRTYGGSDWDRFYSIDLVADSFYVAGSTYSEGAGGSDAWITKIDDLGFGIWSRTDGGPGLDQAWSVKRTPDDGAILAVEAADPDDDIDAGLRKFDAFGSIEWPFSSGGDSVDIGYDVSVADDGGYVLCASTSSFGPFPSFLITKVDGSGSFLWQQVYSAPGAYEPRSIVGRSDGTFAMAGVTTAFGFGGDEAYFMLVDSAGGYLFGTTYGSPEDDDAMAIDVCTDDGFVLCGSSMGPGPGPKAVFVVKTDTSGFTASELIETAFDPTGIFAAHAPQDPMLLHPNPTTSNSILSLGTACDTFTLTDMSGRRVFERSVRPSERTLVLNGVEPGIYVATLLTKGRPLRLAQLVIE